MKSYKASIYNGGPISNDHQCTVSADRRQPLHRHREPRSRDGAAALHNEVELRYSIPNVTLCRKYHTLNSFKYLILQETHHGTLLVIGLAGTMGGWRP